MGTRRPLSQVLPDFPWDTIADVKAKAASHPDGLIDPVSYTHLRAHETTE